MDIANQQLTAAINPEALYQLLMRLKKEYGNPAMLITENGAGFEGEDIKEG